ncbi:MAG: peptidylprolyl isomerase [Saprospiraceae bacterium]|nr:peptidylprolyl isomerase [Saprospiraceae bacterium]
MALIGQIRKNSWILIVMMALASLGVIIMYMSDDRTSLFGGSQFTMGKVNGEKIDWRNFSRVEDVMYRNSSADPYDRRAYLWNYFAEEVLIKKEAEALGLGVSVTELKALEFGPAYSPVIQQRFADPATRQVDVEQLNQFKTAIEGGNLTDPQARAFWAHQEKEIIKDRLQTKLGGMVAKALYTPTWMAELSYTDLNQRFDMAYVQVPFDELDNAEVSLSDDDYAAYLKENAAIYKSEKETRALQYVAFTVAPSAEDSATYQAKIAGYVPEFAAAENDSNFVEQRFGIIDAAYFKKDDISEVIADTVFSMAPGSVYGPYLDNGAYMAVKVLDRKVIPDSVRSRHILIQASNPMELATAQARVDSLKGVIESGAATFEVLAAQFGSDATREKGGDLDFAAPGGMVKPFNDLIFFEAEQGKLYSVVTQFGVHLVEVTAKKFINNNTGVKLAYLMERIMPSDKTQGNVKDKAIALMSGNRKLEDLVAAAKKDKSLSIAVTPLLEANDYNIADLGSGQSGRDMVRWAFTAKKGEVSPEVFSFQNAELLTVDKFVLAGLKTIQPAGLPSVENIREEIKQLVLNKKKGEVLADRMKGMDLQALASKFKTEIDTAQSISFGSGFLPDLGAEPKVIATAAALALNKTSKPIVGSSGVFVVQVYNKPEMAPAADYTATKTSLSSPSRAQIPSMIMQALMKNANIKDSRSKFF